jgi:hypothetical protein
MSDLVQLLSIKVNDTRWIALNVHVVEEPRGVANQESPCKSNHEAVSLMLLDKHEFLLRNVFL